MTKLEQFRIKKKLTKKELRDFLASQNKGLDKSYITIQYWCKPQRLYRPGRIGPSIKHAILLAEIIGCSINEIYQDLPEEPPGGDSKGRPKLQLQAG